MAAEAGATRIDLTSWKANEEVQKMVAKKPSTDNSKVLRLLGGELVSPELSVQQAVASLKEQSQL